MARVSRPIRMLLRLAESGEMPSGPWLFVHHRDWEVFLLYRRVQVLVQQNRAGAGALEELEALHRALAQLRDGLARTGQHGVLAPLELEGGPLADVADLLRVHRERLIGFFRDLKARTEALRSELDLIQDRASARNGQPGDLPQEPFSPTRNGSLDGAGAAAESESMGFLDPVREACAEVRRVGTVLALEAECLAGCGFPTCVQINSRYFENVSPAEVPKIIERLKAEAEGEEGETHGEDARL